MNDSNIEYKAEGVIVADTEEPTAPIKKTKHNSRSIIIQSSPKIYVNDGSNGTNLVDTYSYKNYCDAHEKPSKENHYSNLFKTALTSNPQYRLLIQEDIVISQFHNLKRFKCLMNFINNIHGKL